MRFTLLFFFLFSSCEAFAKVDPPFMIQHAIDVIESTYGDRVEIKPKTLLKFGRSDQVSSSTFTTLMDLPSGSLNETYVSSDLITHISSSSASDTVEIRLEGHICLPNGDRVFRSESVTLQGQTKVALPIPLCRSTRMFNNNSTDLVGTVYVYEDVSVTNGVPQTDSAVHLMIPAGKNQSRKAATTISSKDYYIITGIAASVETKSGTPIAEIQVQSRQLNKVYRTVAVAAVATSGSTFVKIKVEPPIIIPKNADVRLRALGSSNNIDVAGWLNGYLAKIKE